MKIFSGLEGVTHLHKYSNHSVNMRKIDSCKGWPYERVLYILPIYKCLPLSFDSHKCKFEKKLYLTNIDSPDLMSQQNLMALPFLAFNSLTPEDTYRRH